MKVSFDFDWTLKFPNGLAYERMCRLFRRLVKNKHEVFIVTSRMDDKDSFVEIRKFCDENKLFPKRIVFTDHNEKGPMLRRLGITVHFDDDETELASAMQNDVRAHMVWSADHAALFEKSCYY